MKIELDLPEIEGFEYTGEHRKANEGEFYLMGGRVDTKLGPTNGDYPILKKKAPEYITHSLLIADNGMHKMVSINALEDAMTFAIHPDKAWSAEAIAMFKELKDLIK